MTSLATNTARPRISAHRTRIVADAVVSAYIREISAAQPAPEHPVVRGLERREVAAPREVPEPAMVRSTCEKPRIRIRRWAPPERRAPALEAAA